MLTERILPFAMARKLTTDELEEVSAAGTSVVTGHATYNPHGGTDVDADVNIDI